MRPLLAAGDKVKGKPLKLFLLVSIVVLVLAFFSFDLGRYFSLSYLKAQRLTLEQAVAEHFYFASALYFIIYCLTAAFSLPGGATILTLAGGGLFGLLWGGLLVSFASSIGATLAFLSARFLLRAWVQKRFGDKLSAINAGIAEEGVFYLFTLRMVPLFPFFLVNLLMGLTPLSSRAFYLVSQLGMLPATLVYLNAGTQLSQLDSLQGIVSADLLASFALLGLFPLATKKIVTLLRRSKQA